jgi:hypothetical protein
VADLLVKGEKLLVTVAEATCPDKMNLFKTVRFLARTINQQVGNIRIS